MPETPVFSKAAIAAPHSLASEAGRAVLAEGGNAIEAMVAMAATIAVVYPHMNAIGGDGFWLIHEPGGRVRAIEACGFAGSRATIERYRAFGYEAIPPRGPHAALTVPGAIGGWAAALSLAKEHGGRLPLSILLGDAIRHGREGYVVSASEGRDEAKEIALIKQAPGFLETYYFNGERPKGGEKRKVEPLAATLDHLAQAGLDDFYRGDVGREIAADCERIGSPVTRADLERYRAALRDPLSLKIKGATLYNCPPPTQGIASLVILGLFARLNVREADGFDYFHGLVESTKRGLRLRDQIVTDFDRLKRNPADFLSAAWLDKQAAQISMTSSAPFPMPPDRGDTVWMGAIDGNGLAVSYIQSVYWEYGSGCVLPKTGVLLQNRGAAFSLDANALNPLEPGRRPIHTLNPPLAVMDDGRVCVYGAMGGDGQPQFQAQVFSRWAMYGRSPAEAVDAPRYLLGKTWGSANLSLKLESRVDENVARRLESVGQIVERRAEPYADDFGHAGMVVKHAKGHVEAVHDPRSDGGGAGI
ncbi:gamma-glutamyltransferase family protein [Terrarubrum flagellatum]|uniref:gamma-glutamyltransferase family protein n=1 Tax=Terrirubrum flagellatum TaxID=2895980 RepID=UPI0031452000